ncbi:MAG: glycosyltransferase family 39 protein [Chloroflexota bacterium]
MMRRLPGLGRHSWLLLPFILLFFFLAMQSMVRDSPTVDEQNHIARGLALLKTGDPRLSLEHPPLVNTLSAIPLLLLDVTLPTDDVSWETGFWYGFADLLLWGVNQDATRMVFLSRIPIIFMTLGLALVGYHFARELWGRQTAPLAFLLLLFEPNIIAHGRYSTTDLGGTLFSLLATWMLWRLWQGKGGVWQRRLLVVLTLGLAFASKMSVLGFVLIWGVLAVLPLYGGKWEIGTAVSRLVQFLIAGFVSIVVVWAAYGFQWGNFAFTSELLMGLNGASGPMPTFWTGVERIGLLVNEGRFAAFLLGEFSDTGFGNYFPVAFAAKTALPILVLLPIAIVVLFIRPETRKNAGFLLGTAVLFFLLSIQSSLNIGYRHLLPMLPYLLILISGLTTVKQASVPVIQQAEHGPSTMPVLQGVAYLGFIWLLITTFQIHPHYLAYFNPLYGGPENGHNVLIDSNVDWGQDLLRLQKWMADYNVDSVKLAWFGSADPTFYGINHEPLPGLGRHAFYSQWSDPPFTPEQPESGVYAISVNSYWEIPLPPDQKYVFQWFRTQPPSDRVGYSIFIYVVP